MTDLIDLHRSGPPCLSYACQLIAEIATLLLEELQLDDEIYSLEMRRFSFAD
jgi:hypothetical protein